MGTPPRNPYTKKLRLLSPSRQQNSTPFCPVANGYDRAQKSTLSSRLPAATATSLVTPHHDALSPHRPQRPSPQLPAASNNPYHSDSQNENKDSEGKVVGCRFLPQDEFVDKSIDWNHIAFDGDKSDPDDSSPSRFSVFQVYESGVSCTICNVPVGGITPCHDSLLRHIQQKHGSLSPTIVQKFASLHLEILDKLSSLRKKNPRWCEPVMRNETGLPTETRLKCLRCIKDYGSQSAFQRHTKKSKCCFGSFSVRTTFVVLPCGRLKELLDAPPAAAVAPPAVQAPFVQPTPFSDISKKLEEFILEDEDVGTYVSIFTPVFSSSVDFSWTISNAIDRLDTPPGQQEQSLATLLEMGEEWITHRARNEVSLVPGNYRGALLQFEGQDIGEVSQNLIYNFRHSETTFIPELKKLLCFIWRSSLPWLHGFKSNFNRNDPWFVPRLLTVAFHERVESVYHHPLVVFYALARFFKKTRCGSLSMIGCGTNASLCTLLLSLFRVSVCSVICATPFGVDHVAANLVSFSQSCRVANTLSPFIHSLREMQQWKKKRRMVRVDETGTADRFNAAMCVLRRLEERCIVCDWENCSGECCFTIGSCNKCGGPHSRTSCKVNWSTVLRSKGCCHCLDLFKRRGWVDHAPNACPLERRLLRLVIHTAARETPVETHYARIASNHDNFYRFLSSASKSVEPEKITITLWGEQVADDDTRAPLLPPDIYENGDLNMTGETVSYTKADESRSIYQWLKKMPLSKWRRRNFVFGALYQNIIGRSHTCIDASNIRGKLELNIKVAGETRRSTVMIMNVRHHHEMCSSIVQLGATLPNRGNARKDVGDRGCMWGLGRVPNSGGRIYDDTKKNKNTGPAMRRVCLLVRDHLKKHLPAVLKSIQDGESIENKGPALDEMGGAAGLGRCIMISANLGNAAHKDYRDNSLSFAIWVEDVEGEASNWYFIFPNVIVNGKWGLVIRLSHGISIAWDGRRINHGTSVTKVGDNNNVWGCMFGSIGSY